MNVFSYIDPHGPELAIQLVPIWEAAWRQQGWTPRLLTIRNARKHPDFDEEYDQPASYAWEQAGGGWYCPTHTINFSFAPKRLRAKHEFFYGGVLWATRQGAKEIRTNPALGRLPGSNLVSVWPIDPILPLVSFEHCDTLEQVQRGIELCLAAKKSS